MKLISWIFNVLTVKIGRPGYRVTKQFDPETNQRSLLFQVFSQLSVILFLGEKIS